MHSKNHKNAQMWTKNWHNVLDMWKAQSTYIPRPHCTLWKKRLSIFPSPDGMSLTKLSLMRNNKLTKLSLAGNNQIILRHSLVSDKQAEDGKIDNLFLQCLSPPLNWDVPITSLVSERAPPLETKGEATLACGWGGGRVPIPTTGEKA
jgi:hypothetical protein